MKQRYLVKFIETSRKFGDTKVTTATTFNLESFCKTHKVVEAYECEMKGGHGYNSITIGRRVI